MEFVPVPDVPVLILLLKRSYCEPDNGDNDNDVDDDEEDDEDDDMFSLH